LSNQKNSLSPVGNQKRGNSVSKSPTGRLGSKSTRAMKTKVALMLANELKDEEVKEKVTSETFWEKLGF